MSLSPRPWTWEEDVQLVFFRLTVRSPTGPDRPPSHRVVAEAMGKHFNATYTPVEIRRRCSELVGSPSLYQPRFEAAQQLMGGEEDTDRERRVMKAALDPSEWQPFLRALARRYEGVRPAPAIEPAPSGIYKRHKLDEP